MITYSVVSVFDYSEVSVLSPMPCQSWVQCRASLGFSCNIDAWLYFCIREAMQNSC